VIVVGAGTAGMPAATFAAARGARVLLIEAADKVGGTLHLSYGQMSAAGTKLQASKGIHDTPQKFYDDVMHIGGGMSDPAILRLFVENSGATLDWLSDHGYAPFPDHPVLVGGHEPYTTPRYLWAKEGGRAVLAVLETQMREQIAHGGLTLLLETSATDLVQDAKSGAVTGVIAKDKAGRTTAHRAPQVVLTSGGYCSNAEIFEMIEGVKKHVDVYPYSQGAGVRMALAAGATLRNQECRQPLFNGVMATDSPSSPIVFHIESNPRVRPSWEVFVNRHGQRFVQEDTPSIALKEKALKQQPGEACWVVFDEAILNAAPPIARGWTTERIRAAFGQYPTFAKADSLEGLADAAALDKAGLLASIADYNEGQRQGRDSFGRQHMPLPVVKPPFYAIRMQGYYWMDTTGVVVDTSLRVLGRTGKPIPGLYAAGEVLGMGQLQGAGYCGGLAMTPAITFGRLLGGSILSAKT
jgi:fumarate reductase flavoprotein subunit